MCFYPHKHKNKTENKNILQICKAKHTVVKKFIPISSLCCFSLSLSSQNLHLDKHREPGGWPEVESGPTGLTPPSLGVSKEGEWWEQCVGRGCRASLSPDLQLPGLRASSTLDVTESLVQSHPLSNSTGPPEGSHHWSSVRTSVLRERKQLVHCHKGCQRSSQKVNPQI